MEENAALSEGGRVRSGAARPRRRATVCTAIGLVLCFASNLVAERACAEEMMGMNSTTTVTLGRVTQQTWRHWYPPCALLRMRPLRDGRILCAWPTAGQETSKIGGAVYGEGRWRNLEEISLDERCEMFQIDVSGDDVRLVTVANEQDKCARIRWLDVTDWASSGLKYPTESRVLKIDFADPRNRARHSSNSYDVMAVSAEGASGGATWIFGKYNERHKEYLLFFWGGGHVPSPPKFCAWEYVGGTLSGCRPLWEDGLFSGIFSLNPYNPPVYAIDKAGRPYVVFTKEGSGPLSGGGKEGPFLGWWEKGEWKKEKIEVLSRLVEGEKNFDEPSGLEAMNGTLALLWQRVRYEGGSGHVLFLWRDGEKWAPPLTVAEGADWCGAVEAALAVDETRTAHIVWRPHHNSQEIYYRTVKGSSLSEVRSFESLGTVGKIMVAPETKAGLLHIMWSSRKSYDTDQWEVYAKSVPIPEPSASPSGGTDETRRP